MGNTNWEMRDGIDPTHFREAVRVFDTAREAEVKARFEKYDRERQQARDAAWAQNEPFREQLGRILGTKVRTDEVTVHETRSGFELRCRFMQIVEAIDYEGYRRQKRTLPGRDLTAVWTGSQIHIHVTGEPRPYYESSFPRHAEEWNAGPVHTTEDLVRLVERRADHRWKPPADNAPEPAAEPERRSMTDRTQEIIDRLAAQDKYQDGIRGLLLALAMSNLAVAQAQQATDE
ncbi:hypothetical protein [Nocardiopsis synnemataformans]|uniref:hypothetical protein n=1 Tax=Nocardiopsis synnemataformans TaxID=61305 RepID=UPI003EBD0298